MKLIFNIFNSIANAFLLLNFILFLLQFSQRDKAFKIYTIYLGVIIIIQTVSIAFIKFGYQNLSVSHFYFTLQFILLSLFFLELNKIEYQKKIIIISLLLITAIIILNLILDKTVLFKLSLLEIVLTSLAIIIFSTFHFYNMLSSKKRFYLINCGILIYIIGSSVPFLMHNLQATYGKEFGRLVANLNVILYTFYQVLVFIEWKVNFSKKEYEG
ncbi:hypothetical protein [Flavobacterium sp.]|uniref:hypothetical protein n=1 Tax=Flavobacterium sp. TaxID=239 RepID=UPI003750B720